ncbi:hypothetical protein HS041_16195 [Planomonospora sp. ID67723]|uniref:hypothetical protein n=1 Tax=Planomonospora sp. ID67723 TaxID=2738134 RepID=UPI0018C37BB7|nr:hypothetical protein [Planomonospora sp. ID67723]MBG0829308.1 hypothetical protein [Planomonospora sp. ID67723]
MSDDLDERFNALTAQISAEERRRMSRAARRGWANLPWVRRRRRRWVAALVGVTVVAGAGTLLAHRPDLLAEVGAAFSTPVSEAGPSTGAVPEETTPVDVKPVEASPFEGSPAMYYADGVKGLVMPSPEATGGLSEKDVATALRRTRDLLAASHLDRKTLLGAGRPEAFLKLLHPEERAWFLRHLDRRRPGESDTRHWVVAFAPKTADFTTKTIKVDGRVAYAPFRKDGRSGVRIKANYLFVYAVRRPGQPDTARRVLARRTGEILAYRAGGELVVWIDRWNRRTTGARCDVDDGFVHPYYPDSAPDEEASKATAAPTDPYDHDRKPGKAGCGLASRS